MIWIIFLFLSCCQHQGPWRCHHIQEKTADCTRVLYQSSDPVAGIDIEFIHTKNGLSTYFQIHSQPIPSFEEVNKARVLISTPEKQLSGLAIFHKGGQRIQLSSILQEELIFLLKQKKSITIELSGYKETIDLNRFEKSFKKIDRPGLRNPFHLPF